MKFGEKLYDLRKRNGYTKVELAKMLGVTTRTIAGYEKEERYPKKREIYQKLSDIFHVPLNYLYTENTSSDEFIANVDEWKHSSLHWTYLNCSPPGSYPMKIWMVL